MHATRCLVLAVGLLLIQRQDCWAYSDRERLAFDLHTLSRALSRHQEATGSFPTEDICDELGRPLLSWRVRLLETANPPLYGRFRLEEPWDSAHNSLLIREIPSWFEHRWRAPEGDRYKTRVLALRGPNTFFDGAAPRRLRDIKNPLTTMVMLVEGDAEHAVVWSQPQDLPYDPDLPLRGLGREWTGGLFREKGCFVLMADGTSRFLSETTDPDLARGLFSIAPERPPRTSGFLFHALCRRPLGAMMAGSLALRLGFVVVAVLIVRRMVKGLATSLGELLVMIIGAQQVIYLVAFVACYRYDELPGFCQDGDGARQILLTLMPTVAGVLAAYTAYYWQKAWDAPALPFIGVAVMLTVLGLEGAVPYNYWTPETSLAQIGHPLSTAVAALALAQPAGTPHGVVRQRWHWACVAAALVPALWFGLWWHLEIVKFRPFGERYLI